MLIEGKSKLEVARNFGIKKDSVYSHFKKHMPVELAKAQEERQEEGLNVLEELEKLIREARSILDEARQKGSNGLALSAIGRIQSAIETLARIQLTLAKETHIRAEVDSISDFESQIDLSALTDEEIVTFQNLALKVLSPMSGATVGGDPAPAYEDYPVVREIPKVNNSAQKDEGGDSAPSRRSLLGSSILILLPVMCLQPRYHIPNEPKQPEKDNDMNDLRTTRKNLGYSLEKLEALSGIDRRNISRIENKLLLPTMAQIETLEKLLGPVEWFDPLPEPDKEKLILEFAARAERYPLSSVLTSLRREAREIIKENETLTL